MPKKCVIKNEKRKSSKKAVCLGDAGGTVSLCRPWASLGGQNGGAGGPHGWPARPREAPAGPDRSAPASPLHAAASSLHASHPQPRPQPRLSSSAQVYSLTSISELSENMGNNQHLRKKKKRAGWLGRKDSPCTHTYQFTAKSPTFRSHTSWPWTNLDEPPSVNPQGTTQSLFQPAD